MQNLYDHFNILVRESQTLRAVKPEVRAFDLAHSLNFAIVFITNLTHNRDETRKSDIIAHIRRCDGSLSGQP